MKIYKYQMMSLQQRCEIIRRVFVDVPDQPKGTQRKYLKKDGERIRCFFFGHLLKQL